MKKERMNVTTAATASVATLDAPAGELTDEQADFLIQRLEWALGLKNIERAFFIAFGVGVTLELPREEARAAVRRMARVGG